MKTFVLLVRKLGWWEALYLCFPVRTPLRVKLWIAKKAGYAPVDALVDHARDTKS